MPEIHSNLQDLLILFLAIFLIIIIWFAFKTLNDETLFVIIQDTTWISIMLLIVVIIFSLGNIHENDLLIVLIIAIFIVMVAVQVIALLNTTDIDRDNKEDKEDKIDIFDNDK